MAAVIKTDEVSKIRLPGMPGVKASILISELDGAPNFSMRLFELEPSSVIPPHKHPWEHEIFVIEGEGEIRVGGQLLKVREGEAVYIPPGVEHSYKNQSRDKPFKFLCIVPNEGNKDLLRLARGR